MAKKGSKDYFGFPWILSVIFAIFPPTSLIFGIITRFKEGHWVCALFRIFFGWNIIWLLDLICMIFAHHIFKLF